MAFLNQEDDTGNKLDDLDTSAGKVKKVPNPHVKSTGSTTASKSTKKKSTKDVIRVSLKEKFDKYGFSAQTNHIHKYDEKGNLMPVRKIHITTFSSEHLKTMPLVKLKQFPLRHYYDISDEDYEKVMKMPKKDLFKLESGYIKNKDDYSYTG